MKTRLEVPNALERKEYLGILGANKTVKTIVIVR